MNLAKEMCTTLNLNSADFRIVIPSDGNLHQPTQVFMRACNLEVMRSDSRSYTGVVPSLGNIKVLFQRVADVILKVEEGSAELGITGLDRFLELRRESGNAMILIDDLGFGQCKLTLAVPDTWLDISSVDDLADLSLDFRRMNRQLRIATKYPRLVRQYLLNRGISHFSLVMAGGALEAAPIAGYADLIADLTSTGETLRQNRLRELEEGDVLTSQACLIGNRVLIGENPRALRRVRDILEMMEAYRQGRGYYRLSANINSTSEEALAAKILNRPDLAGLQGPTISKVHTLNGHDWYSINIVVSREDLLEVVEHLRVVGANEISISKIEYMYSKGCSAYATLLDNLKK